MKITNIFFDKLEREEMLKNVLSKLEDLRKENQKLKDINLSLRAERLDNLKHIYENEKEILYFFNNYKKIKVFAIGKEKKLLAIYKDKTYNTYFEMNNIPNEEYYICRKKLEDDKDEYGRKYK